MWIYEKKLQYPVKIKCPDSKLAQLIITQLGGPDGEMGASTRYLNQRYSMKDPRCIGILTDIGKDEIYFAYKIDLHNHEVLLKNYLYL